MFLQCNDRKATKVLIICATLIYQVFLDTLLYISLIHNKADEEIQLDLSLSLQAYLLFRVCVVMYHRLIHSRWYFCQYTIATLV